MNRWVTSGDLALAVYTWGGPARGKPNVVLVHGYPDAAGVWEKTAEILAERYHVIAYDVRGAGRSGAPDRTAGYALKHLVNDLAAVVDAMSPDAPVHLVGHDWGSIQCWEAVTDAHMADRIASYTSISGPCLDHAAYWIRKRLRSVSATDLAQVARQLSRSWYIGLFQLPGLGEAMWKLGLGKLWPKVLKRTERIEREASDTQTRDGSHGINLYRANFVQRLLRPQQRRTEIPLQLIVPTRDRFMVREIWDDLARWVPNLRRHEIDAGHWVQISHPDEIASLVRAFIDDLAQIKPRGVARESSRR